MRIYFAYSLHTFQFLCAKIILVILRFHLITDRNRVNIIYIFDFEEGLYKLNFFKNTSILEPVLLTRFNGNNQVTNMNRLHSELTTLGLLELMSITAVRQKLCIENKIGTQLLEGSKINSYKRFIFNRMLIHTTTYERLNKRNSSTIYLKNDKFLDITHFLSLL